MYDCMCYDYIWGLYDVYCNLEVFWYGSLIFCDVFCGWVYGRFCFFIQFKFFDNFFNWGYYYGVLDDYMCFVFFFKVVMEFLLCSNKCLDIIYCYDW